MIKIGNILIDPNDVSSIQLEMKTPERGLQTIQIIYKSGVVKNFTSAQIGMNYQDLIEEFMKQSEKKETDRIFRLMTALKSMNNG